MPSWLRMHVACSLHERGFVSVIISLMNIIIVNVRHHCMNTTIAIVECAINPLLANRMVKPFTNSIQKNVRVVRLSWTGIWIRISD